MKYIAEYKTDIGIWHIDDKFQVWFGGCRITNSKPSLQSAKNYANKDFQERIQSSVKSLRNTLNKSELLSGLTLAKATNY